MKTRTLTAITLLAGSLAAATVAGAVTISTISEVHSSDHYYHEYVLVDGFTGDWQAAQEEVGSLLGDDWFLATITSQAEQDFVVENLLRDREGEYWLGGYQQEGGREPDGGWAWVTGESWDFTNWYLAGLAGGEPNQWDGTQEQWLGTWSKYGWQWNDEHGNANIRGFVAERMISNPEPGTMILLGSGLLFLARKTRQRIGTAGA